jgi:8-amino-7-oxononanoate synthase
VSRDWLAWAAAETAAIRAAGRWREVRDLDGGGPRFGELVSFASNDYLGLSQHPAVRVAAHGAIERWGTGSGSARLIVGSRPVHSELEGALAEWKGAERALLFSSGYAANLGVLSALAGPETTIVSDELNHASIIDGCRLSRAGVAVFRHGDLDHARELVRAAPGPVVVVSDTVFSMDGDVADVSGLAEICDRYGALLVLDEAHGVLGPHHRVEGVACVRVGTLSKTLGSLGGFAAGPAPLVDLLRNRARPFIFTTALTPADAAAALAALGVLRSPEGTALLARLRANIDAVRPGHPSPIIPVVLGSEEAALAASARLAEGGIIVPAIRPPTVPPGTSRLRIALSAAHTPDDIGRLVRALGELCA